MNLYIYKLDQKHKQNIINKISRPTKSFGQKN